jgi:hypothetical protein
MSERTITGFGGKLVAVSDDLKTTVHCEDDGGVSLAIAKFFHHDRRETAARFAEICSAAEGMSIEEVLKAIEDHNKYKGQWHSILNSAGEIIGEFRAPEETRKRMYDIYNAAQGMSTEEAVKLLNMEDK